MAAKPGEVTNREVSFITLILKAEPDFYAQRKREKLYEFTGREVRGDPNKVATAYPDE